MILRKPYAFLIRHFKKIHWLLLLLCVYIFYKNAQLTTFIKDYMNFGVYDPYLEPVSRYASIFFYISAVLVVIISGIVIYLLHFKKKPHRFYYIIILEYLALLIVFFIVARHFALINDNSTVTSLLAMKDMLFILSLPQYLILLLLFIRAIGLDLSKFGFEKEEAYLAVTDRDNEEFEVAVDVDKDRFKRVVRRKLRYFRYFYQEHKVVLTSLMVLLLAGIIGYTSLYYLVFHKTYKEQDSYIANGYEIKINQSYLTDKDASGKLILPANSQKQFVIVDLTVTNHGSKRTMNVDKFHLLNKNSSTTPTLKYNQSFQDFGTPYEKVELRSNEKRNFLLIYLVEKKLQAKDFVMYYQETVTLQKLSIKKTKLAVRDVSKIDVSSTKNLNEEMTLKNLKEQTKKIKFTEVAIKPSVPYYYQRCYVDDCPIVEGILTAKEGQNILHISFLSDDFSGWDFIDFSRQYGKMKYVNPKGETVEVTIKSAVDRKYQGNDLYLLVPLEMIDAKEITFHLIIRDQEYIYRLR